MRRSRIALAVFFAVTSAFGIVAHLASEVAGLGWSDDSDLLTSPRHAYLAAIAVGIFVAFVATLVRLPKRERRARIASLIEALPFRGRGFAFVALSFAAQFGFFAVTQIGEGCPLCSGDILTGVLAAAIAAAVGALVISLGQRRLLNFVIALCELLDVVAPAIVRDGPGNERRRCDAARSRRRSTFAFRYRPPPMVIASN